ncbi:MAG: hypothetical protein QM817_36360 [Archangium sp.]
MFSMRLALLCFVAAMATSGCRHRRISTVSGPGMNVKREAALLEAAEIRLGCSQNLVGAFEVSLESNYHVYRVDGCGKRFYALLHCTGICNWREAPEMRAESELQCPAAQLTRAYEPVMHVFTISGCGRTAQYELGQGHLRPVNNASTLGAPVVMPPPSSGSNAPPPPPPPPPAP